MVMYRMHEDRKVNDADDIRQRTDLLFAQHQQRLHRHTDHLFAGLMLLQWFASIAAALWLSPRTWAGANSQPHVHVWAALYLGGAITLFPVSLAFAYPGTAITRQATAVGQMLMSGLLIHLTGGRIETHFHVFGSLAFLAFYRDWRVILTGTLVTAADHLLRGLFWPQSVFAVETAEAWRWLEHAGWVVFEDVFLLLSCASSLREVRGICERDARLEESNADLECKVAARTQQIEYQAYHDTLTCLPNRALFLNRLDQALKRMPRGEKGVAVLYLDLDNFKRVNDTQGHAAGDLLLREVAARLSRCVRDGDTVARLGGDEFTLLLEGLDGPEEAHAVAERALAELASPIPLPQGQAFVGASIGIAYAAGRERSDMLTRDADAAMYHAKALGKGTCAFFTPDMNDRARERVEIEAGLRQALENGELHVHYQPLMDLVTGQMTGLEALARWQHPQRGFIPPALFIPIAEEVGLIRLIGYWVMEEACREVKGWMDRHAECLLLSINVNLSGRQLQQPDVVKRVAEVLQKTGLPASQLKLEITESVFLGDTQEVVGKLQELKALGVKLAIDDFGTGYSSMATLNAFPVDTVKIDRAFISRLGEEEGAAVVAAIISLSRAMHLNITSEGVETAEQVVQLQGLGCDTGQGYFFAKPMPGEDMEARLKTGGIQLAAGTEGLSATDIDLLLSQMFAEPKRHAA